MKIRKERTKEPEHGDRNKFTKFKLLGESAIENIKHGLAIAALGTMLAFGTSSCASSGLAVPMAMEQKKIEKREIVTDLIWKRTHLVIINGDSELRHKNNAAKAARTGIMNNAAAVYLAGLTTDEPKAVRKFNADPKALKNMFDDVLKNSEKDDSVFVYITGHGEPDAFVLENGGKLDYNTLLGLLKDLAGKRNLIFLSDACFSANFADSLISSKEFPHITAMSPGLKDEKTTCDYFSTPFWHALENKLDLDRNGIATIEEAFYYGLSRYRQLVSGTFGTYNKSIPEVNDLAEIDNGVVMVTAVGCAPCRLMEHVFHKANLLLKGTVDFYQISAVNVSYVDAVPAIFIIKDKKILAQSEGALDLNQLRELLKNNGISMDRFSVSLKDLYAEGKYDSIALISTYEEVLKELGPQTAYGIYRALIDHNDPYIALNAVKALAELGTASDVPALIESFKKGGGTFDIYTGIKKALEKIGKPAVPSLIEVAQDPTSKSQYGAVELLGKIGDPSAIPILIELLKSDDSSLSWHAAESLGQIGKAAVPALLEVMRLSGSCSTNDSAKRASNTLASLHDPSAVPILFDILKKHNYNGKSDNSYQYAGASSAFSNIGKHAVPFLDQKLASGSYGEKLIAVNILGMIKDQSAALALAKVMNNGYLSDHNQSFDSNTSLLFDAGNALCSIGKPAVSVVIDLLNADHRNLRSPDVSYLRSQSVYVLGEIGDKSVIQHLLKLLDDKDDYLRMRVWTALDKIRRKQEGTQNEAISALVEISGQQDEKMRYWAALALIYFNDNRGLLVLQELSKNALTEDIRTKAGNALKPL